MAIITHTKSTQVFNHELLNTFPDQYVSEKVKETHDWWKGCLDYFYSVAINSYATNVKSFGRNYEILKGVLRREDFYETPEVGTFTDELLKAEDLPQYVKNYSIMAAPINVMVGDLSRRPDTTFVRDFGSDGKNEKLQFRTEVLHQFIFEKARERIYMKMAMEGIEVDEEEIKTQTEDSVREYMNSYTTTAERWGSKALEFLKRRLFLKEKSEDSFRDLLITGREAFLIYENGSDVGFGVRSINPINVWDLSSPDEKYTSDPFDPYRGSFAAGVIEVMEMTAIIDEFDLSKEEVDHLVKSSQESYLLSGRESNYGSGATGSTTIHYDTYDRAVFEARQFLESELTGGIGGSENHITDLLLPGSDVSVFGNKFVVLRAYWYGKKKIGKLTYIDEDDMPITLIVDESYKAGSHPREISLEWAWINQIYQGVKIGNDIYFCKPFELLDYIPVISSVFEGRNTPPKGLVDLLKPYQTLCNVFLNKVFDFVNIDLGPVFLTSLRSLPIAKDGDAQDAIDNFIMEAKERGIMFIDDDPQMQGGANFNQHKVQDMSRINQMIGYFNLYLQTKREAQEIVGFTKERMGSVQASQTATGVNTSVSRSYSMTEPWYTHHEYTMTKLMQAILDAAQYIESSKEESVLSLITDEGTDAFIKISGSELALSNLGVVVTSRSEDIETFNNLKELSHAMLQNGMHAYDIAEIHTTRSTSHIKDVLRRSKEEMQRMHEEQMAMKQAEMEQAQEQFQQAQQLAILEADKARENDNMNKQLDRESAERVALYRASQSDNPNTSEIDPVAKENLRIADSRARNEFDMKSQQIAQRQQEILNRNQLENKKLDLQNKKLEVDREKIRTQERIARINKNKYDK